MAPNERNYRFNMMLSDEEERMLRTLAEGRGLTASSTRPTVSPRSRPHG
jgi:hypothetical protein